MNSVQNRLPKILIIDDDRDFAESQSLLLAAHGYENQTAYDRHEATKLAGSFDADIALIDIKLGQTNGINLIEELSFMRPEITCILVTAFSNIETAIEGLKKGAYDYLRKPLNPDLLLATLKRCCEKISLEKEKNSVQKALNETEQQITASFNQAAIGISHLSLEGQSTLFNQKFCDILGYSGEEIKNQPFSKFIDPDDLNQWNQIKTKLINRDSEFLSQNFRFLRKKDSKVWVHLTISLVFDAEEQPKYFICFLENISARVESERVLKQYAANLERSNQELRDFAFIASHDLQEPLRKIIAFGDLLRKNIPNLENVAEDYLEKMQSSAERVVNLINALLQFSRVTNHKPVLEKVSLRKVIEDSLSDLQILLQESKGQVEFLPDSQDGIIYADRFQLERVFQNLISNAIKFHKENEPPKVTVKIQPGASSESSWEIYIQDNGIGFEKKYSEQIFKPFKRLHEKTAYEGHGMGLAICQNVISQMSGGIYMQSQPGKGTCVIVTLPQNPRK